MPTSCTLFYSAFNNNNILTNLKYKHRFVNIELLINSQNTIEINYKLIWFGLSAILLNQN